MYCDLMCYASLEKKLFICTLTLFKLIRHLCIWGENIKNLLVEVINAIITYHCRYNMHFFGVLNFLYMIC